MTALDHKPGERVPQSGLYRVIHEGGEEHQVTAVKGERFPPSRLGKGVHYTLAQAALHFHEHQALAAPKPSEPTST